MISALLRTLASRCYSPNRPAPRCFSSEVPNCWLQADPNPKAEYTWGYIGVRLAGPTTITSEFLQEVSLRVTEQLPITALRAGVLSQPLAESSLQQWLSTQQDSNNPSLTALSSARAADQLKRGLRERLGYLIVRMALPVSQSESAQFDALHYANTQLLQSLLPLVAHVGPLTADDLDRIEAPLPADMQAATWRVATTPAPENEAAPALSTALQALDAAGTPWYHAQLTAVRVLPAQVRAGHDREMQDAHNTGRAILRAECILQIRGPAEGLLDGTQPLFRLRREGLRASPLGKEMMGAWPAAATSKRWPWLTSSMLGHLLPVIPGLAGQAPGAGGMLLRAVTGEARVFSPFSGYWDNHTLVVGQAGSGVSFTMSELLVSHLAEGGAATIFDADGSYRRLAEAVGGQVIEVSDTDLQGLDPLPLIKDMLSLEAHHDTLVSWLCLLAAVAEDDYRARAELATAILKAWAHAPGQLTLSRVQLELTGRDETRQLANQLALYVPGGEYGAMFQGAPRITRTQPLVRVDISSLRQAPSFVVPTLLLQAYLPLRMAAGEPRVLFALEHLDLMGSASELTSRLMRGMRMRRAGILLGVQPSEVALAPWSCIVPYISHRIFQAVGATDLEGLLQSGVISPDGRDLLRPCRLAKHRYSLLVLQTPDGTSQFILDVDATTMGVLSSCYRLRQRYEASRADGLPILEAARCAARVTQ